MKLWGRWRSRLYLQVYLAFLGIVVMFAIATVAAFVLLHDDAEDLARLHAAERVVTELLPPVDAPVAELETALASWHEDIGLDLTVLDANGSVLASAGRVIEWPAREGDRAGFFNVRKGRTTAGVRLRDGRMALVSRDRGIRLHWLFALAFLGLAIAIGAHPLARRITRRLERLRVRVDELGGGDLGARVDVEGRDEVALLARSFNAAAARIEALVQTQTSVLAGASHELRSPLTRMRMAVELLEDGHRPELLARMRDDIHELDELIEELLAASRFQVNAMRREDLTEVDLLALAAEEAARVDATVAGESTPYHGESRWLVRMLRNLLENARRHSGAEHICVTVTPMADGAEIVVEDDGDGIPDALRERIFEPFYRPPGMREGRDRGVGLGLALVRQIAERHRGSARCEAHPVRGTRFVVRLGDTQGHDQASTPVTSS